MKCPIAAILIFATLALGACSSATDTAADTTAASETTAQSVSGSDTTVSGNVVQTDPVVETIAAVEPPASAPSTVTVAKAVTHVAVQPGLSGDKFVGAASDVKTTNCKRSGDHWAASGTVTNSSGTDAGYRIYVAFNRVGSTDTRALVQTDVAVSNGKSQPWKAAATITDEALTCVLRVERTAKA